MSKSISVKLKKNLYIGILFLTCILLVQFLHKKPSHEKFMQLEIGMPYKKVIRQFGKPFTIADSKNGVQITYMLNDGNSYVLDFNLWFKLCGLNYGMNDVVFFDNRNPVIFKEEKKNTREDIERLLIGTTLNQIMAEFGEPDVVNDSILMYKYSESKCYKLKFSGSGKLMGLDIWSDYIIRGREYLEGKRIPLFYDKRIE